MVEDEKTRKEGCLQLPPSFLPVLIHNNNNVDDNHNSNE